jgi:DNA-binding GntR family transcriptional regulator
LDPYRGFRVIPVTREDLHDIFWVQETISTELARRAATRITTDTIDLLEEIQDKVRAAADSEDLNQVGLLNNEFHRIINRAAESPKLGWLLAMTVRYTPPRLLAEVPEWTKVSDADHRKLIAGFRAGDAEKVADEMSKHIRNSDRTLGRHMEAQHFWDSQEEIAVATDQPVP